MSNRTREMSAVINAIPQTSALSASIQVSKAETSMSSEIKNESRRIHTPKCP